MKKGFTLIEVLAVVLIIGILSAIAMPQYRKSIERTRISEAKQLLPAIYDAQQRHDVEVDTVSDVPSFAKLDINLKGTIGRGSNEWETANFSYILPSHALVYQTMGTTNAPVFAMVKEGKFRGTQILYDGENFYCNNQNSYTQTPDPCDQYQIASNSTYNAMGNAIYDARTPEAIAREQNWDDWDD